MLLAEGVSTTDVATRDRTRSLPGTYDQCALHRPTINAWRSHSTAPWPRAFRQPRKAAHLLRLLYVSVSESAIVCFRARFINRGTRRRRRCCRCGCVCCCRCDSLSACLALSFSRCFIATTTLTHTADCRPTAAVAETTTTTTTRPIHGPMKEVPIKRQLIAARRLLMKCGCNETNEDRTTPRYLLCIASSCRTRALIDRCVFSA